MTHATPKGLFGVQNHYKGNSRKAMKRWVSQIPWKDFRCAWNQLEVSWVSSFNRNGCSAILARGVQFLNTSVWAVRKKQQFEAKLRLCFHTLNFCDVLCYMCFELLFEKKSNLNLKSFSFFMMEGKLHPSNLTVLSFPLCFLCDLA